MSLVNFKRVALIFLLFSGGLIMISCTTGMNDTINKTGDSTNQTAISSKPDETNIGSTNKLNTFNPQRTVKPGYNSYGIPGSELWQLMNEDGSVKVNVDEIIDKIKEKYGIPKCITGIPWDDKAQKLLIDKNGALVSNWEKILEDLKKEWGAID